MRIIDTIPHPQIRISILYMNEKFIVRFEDGPYEQHYKFTKEMAADVEQVKKIINQSFIQEVRKVFDIMHQNFKNSYLKNQ